MDPTLGHSCREELKRSEPQKAGVVTVGAAKLKPANPHVAFVLVFFLASKLFRIDSEFSYC